MGNDSSKAGHQPEIDDINIQQQSNNLHGWRILHVYPNSPSSNHHIIPYLECITHINNVLLSGSETQVAEMIKEGDIQTYTLYNIVTHKIRDIRVKAQRFSSGPGLLGLMIKYQNFNNWTIECIHIIDVYSGCM